MTNKISNLAALLALGTEIAKPRAQRNQDVIDTILGRASTNAERKRRKKQAGTAKINPPGPLDIPAAPSSPKWRTLYATMLTTITTCRCGTMIESPSRELAVTFQNLRSGGTWTRSSPLDLIPPAIPRRTLAATHRTCEVCPDCFQAEGNGDERQLSLWPDP